MQGIYNYIPEKDHVSMVHDVAAVLWLQFMIHVMLFPMINDLYFPIGLPEVCVQCLTRLFSAVPRCPAFHVCR